METSKDKLSKALAYAAFGGLILYVALSQKLTRVSPSSPLPQRTTTPTKKTDSVKESPRLSQSPPPVENTQVSPPTSPLIGGSPPVTSPPPGPDPQPESAEAVAGNVDILPIAELKEWNLDKLRRAFTLSRNQALEIKGTSVETNGQVTLRDLMRNPKVSPRTIEKIRTWLLHR